MARIQQSIEVKLPVHVVYNQLTQFEDYPQFMDEVQSVMQVDETRLHWTTMMANRPVEWDAEISEQQQDRCIAWHNLNGPTNTGRVDVEPVGDNAARVTMTLDSEPEQVPGSMAGQTEPELALRLRMDLGRLKTFLEQRGGETDSRDGAAQDGQGGDRVAGLGLDRGTGRGGGSMAGREADTVAPLGADAGAGRTTGERENLPDPQEGRGGPRNSPVPMESYGAGAEGMSGDEDPTSLVNASRQAAAQRNDAAGSTHPQRQASTQSDHSLARAAGENGSGGDGRFSIAEEVNLDEQANALRHVGQMPQDTSIGEAGQASDAVGNAMSQGDRGANTDEAEMKRKLDKNLPPPQ